MYILTGPLGSSKSSCEEGRQERRSALKSHIEEWDRAWECLLSKIDNQLSELRQLIAAPQNGKVEVDRARTLCQRIKQYLKGAPVSTSYLMGVYDAIGNQGMGMIETAHIAGKPGVVEELETLKAEILLLVLAQEKSTL